MHLFHWDRAYMYIAYKEGWGLYSEFLGHDLGLYEGQPLKELGYIKGDLLRSARLVVDTGIHRYGWSRENAVGMCRNLKICILCE